MDDSAAGSLFSMLRKKLNMLQNIFCNLCYVIPEADSSQFQENFPWIPLCVSPVIPLGISPGISEEVVH